MLRGTSCLLQFSLHLTLCISCVNINDGLPWISNIVFSLKDQYDVYTVQVFCIELIFNIFQKVGYLVSQTKYLYYYLVGFSLMLLIGDWMNFIKKTCMSITNSSIYKHATFLQQIQKCLPPCSMLWRALVRSSLYSGLLNIHLLLTSHGKQLPSHHIRFCACFSKA